MGAAVSRLKPQHRAWHCDLPEPTSSPQLLEEARLAWVANQIDDRHLEVGRVGTVLRGLYIAFLPLLVYLAIPLIEMIWGSPLDAYRAGNVFEYLGVLALLAGLLFTTLYLCRLDLFTPREIPVRFCRVTRKIYWNGYRKTWNPLGRWHPVIKVWSWDAVQAEILKVAGFNGKVYMVRYHLGLALCKPGGRDVVDRDTLMGPSMTTAEFKEAWTYLCRYMENGPGEGMAAQPLRDNSVHYVRSLLNFYPWLLPGRWGQPAREEMFSHGWTACVVASFVACLTLLGAPLFLYLGITNYLALKVAPVAHWPEGIDAESRGLTLSQLRLAKSQSASGVNRAPRWSSIIAGLLTIAFISWLVSALF